MTRPRTTYALLVVVVVVLLAIKGMPFAEAKPIPPGCPNDCPADIDEDGIVAVPDVLTVLAAWGPCPSPRIVGAAATASGGTNLLVRIWSDGFAEYRVAWGQNKQPQAWTPLPANPQVPLSRPVAVCASESPLVVYRQWADGTVDWIPIILFANKFVADATGWRTAP